MRAMAGTRMAHPDMAIENNVLNALVQVKSYKKTGKSNIALCNASGRPAALPEKKAASVKLSVLNGETAFHRL